MRLSQPKIDVLKQLNEKPGVPTGSRFATFKSLRDAGLIRKPEDGVEHDKYGLHEITDKGRTALSTHVGEAPALHAHQQRAVRMVSDVATNHIEVPVGMGKA